MQFVQQNTLLRCAQDLDEKMHNFPWDTNVRDYFGQPLSRFHGNHFEVPYDLGWVKPISSAIKDCGRVGMNQIKLERQRIYLKALAVVMKR